MHRGWIRLWRKSLDSPLWQNWRVWRLFEWLLLKASHKEHSLMVGYRSVNLLPGQVIFGRRQAARETGLSERQTRTALSLLISTHTVTIETSHSFSIVTICNWAIYESAGQSNDPHSDPLSAQPVTHQRPASDPPATTNKNEKNVKNEKHLPQSPPEQEAQPGGEILRAWSNARAARNLPSVGLPSLSPLELDTLQGIQGSDLEVAMGKMLDDSEWKSKTLNTFAKTAERWLNGSAKKCPTTAGLVKKSGRCQKCGQTSTVILRPDQECGACPRSGCGGRWTTQSNIPRIPVDGPRWLPNCTQTTDQRGES